MASPMKVDNYAGNGDYGFDSIRMWSTAAATAGDWFAILANDVTNPAGLEGFSVSAADSDNTGQDYDVVGVILDTTTAAGYVNIQTRGRYSTANVVTGVTKGQNLVISATAGRAEAVGAETADTRIIGRALADSAANVGDVWIYPHPAFI